MSYDDVIYSSTYFGYSIPLKLILELLGYEDEDEDYDESDYLNEPLIDIKEAWLSFIGDKLSDSQCSNISEIEFYPFYVSYIACYERETRSNLYMVFGYKLNDFQYSVNETTGGSSYNFSFNFPPNAKELYLDFLVDYYLKVEPNFSQSFKNQFGLAAQHSINESCSADEKIRIVKKNFREKLEFGLFGSVRRY